MSNDEKIVFGDDKALSYNLDLLQLRKEYKNGFLGMKIKVEYSNPREPKYHLSRGHIVKFVLTINIKGRLVVGVCEKQKIFDERKFCIFNSTRSNLMEKNCYFCYTHVLTTS